MSGCTTCPQLWRRLQVTTAIYVVMRGVFPEGYDYPDKWFKDRAKAEKYAASLGRGYEVIQVEEGK